MIILSKYMKYLSKYSVLCRKIWVLKRVLVAVEVILSVHTNKWREIL